MEFDESIEMWTMIRPNAESPGSIISPKMLFQTGNYTVKIVARCIELDRQVDVDLNLEGRSIGRLSFTYAKSASTLNFSIGSNTTTSLKITIDGGSSTMLAISEIIVFGPRR